MLTDKPAELKTLAGAIASRMRLYQMLGVDFFPGSPASVSALDALLCVRDTLGDCRRCKLCTGRTNIVFGSGNPNATLMFVGEGPGEEEDHQGLPFVGRAGQLLTKMIVAMGVAREDVYIANVVKCRPPNNRPPQPDEIAACRPFLYGQIEAIRPTVICTLGTFATQTLLQTQQVISSLRGIFHPLRGSRHACDILPTYHPAYLLRNPNAKTQVWGDLQKIMLRLQWPSPRGTT